MAPLLHRAAITKGTPIPTHLTQCSTLARIRVTIPSCSNYKWLYTAFKVQTDFRRFGVFRS